MACVSALGAASALASEPVQHHFVASALKKGSEVTFSEASPGKLVNIGEGPQEFRLKPFIITCTSAKSKGAITSNFSKTIFEKVKYSGCTTPIKIGSETVQTAAKFKGAVDYEYNANGFLEDGAESQSNVRLVNASSIEISVQHLGKCLIEMEAQTLPEKAEEKPEKVYGDAVFAPFTVPNLNTKFFPGGEQTKLQITNNFKKIEYEIEGGLCEQFERTSGEAGTASGILNAELKDGNLSWE